MLTHFVQRPDDFLRLLKNSGAARPGKPVILTESARRVAWWEWLGRQVACRRRLARKRSVRMSFPDGLFWLTLGQNPRLRPAGATR